MCSPYRNLRISSTVPIPSNRMTARALTRNSLSILSARTFEPVSLSGSESADLLLLLMSLETPTPEVVRAVDSAYAASPSATLFEIQRERRVSLVVLKP